jgi:hypothetical protein
MAKKAKEQSEWRITEIRAKGKVLGRVMAATAEMAIEAAVNSRSARNAPSAKSGSVWIRAAR